MVSKQRKVRGTILGLALTAMLAFGALGAGAAQASPTWQINGAQFLGEETITSSGGPFTFEMPEFGELSFTCDEHTYEGFGEIFGGDEGQAILSFTDCGEFWEYCEVAEPFSLLADIDLVQVEGVVYERYTPASKSGVFGMLGYRGPECSLSDWDVPVRGSFAAEVGAEATALPLAFSAAAEEATNSGLNILEGSMSIAGESVQVLNGSNEGAVWGATG